MYDRCGITAKGWFVGGEKTIFSECLFLSLSSTSFDLTPYINEKSKRGMAINKLLKWLGQKEMKIII